MLFGSGVPDDNGVHAPGGLHLLLASLGPSFFVVKWALAFGGATDVLDMAGVVLGPSIA